MVNVTTNEKARMRRISVVPSAADDEDCEVLATSAGRAAGQPAQKGSPQPVASLKRTGTPALAPSSYEVVSESCDWCLTETPWLEQVNDGDEDGILAAEHQNSCCDDIGRVKGKFQGQE